MKKYVGIMTMEELSEKEEILFKYGSFDNRYLLKWYGFTVENNPYDRVPLYLKNHLHEKMIHFSSV